MPNVYGLDHVQIAMPPNGESLARNFYNEVLGLPEIPKPAVLAVRGGVWFQCGALQLHLGIETDFRPAKKAHPALLVEGLDELLDRLRTNGCVVTPGEPLEGMTRAFTRDPFGNRIELIERHA